MSRLTKKQGDLLEELCSSSKTWGWQEDSGYGRSVVTAEKHYNEAREAMTKYLQTLSVRLRRASPKTPQPQFKTFDEWFEAHGKHNAKKECNHVGVEHLMRLAWEVSRETKQ